MSRMKFDENLAAVHGYLCADGYVIRNPETQKHKYYAIGLRNQNVALLKDFQKRFHSVFGVKPHAGQDRARINSKEIYNKLTRDWNFYSNSWRLPVMSTENLKFWLRAFFDCEAWVEVQGRKNRRIGLDSINHEGLIEIQKSLKLFGIESQIRTVKDRNIFRLQIFGKTNIENFAKKIGFVHPDKNKKLEKAVDSYPDYIWNFPDNLDKLRGFIRNKTRIKRPYTIRIFSVKKQNITTLRDILREKFDMESQIHESRSGQGIRYFELAVQKKDSVKKALKHDLLNKKQISRMEVLK